MIDSYNGRIYTDGSKTGNGIVAAAFYVSSADVRQAARLNDDVTIYAAEMTAINMVLQWLMTLAARHHHQQDRRGVLHQYCSS